MVEDTQNKELVVKQLQKVESVGKTGKVKKGISLSNDFSLMLRSYLNEFSFKMLAYVIKGYLIILKKNYENFSKEISHFVEINLKLRQKGKKENETKDKNIQRTEEEKKSHISMDNYRLLCDLSQNDLSGFSSDLAKQFLSTIKKMKKSNNPTIKSLYEGVENSGKLEFLIKSLSDNVKKSQNLLNHPHHMENLENNNLANIFQENENLFSTYINLSMKIDDNNSIRSLRYSEQNNLQEIIEAENEPPNHSGSQTNAFFGLDEKKELLFLNKLGLSKDIGEKKLPFFKFDKELNLSPDEMLNNLIEAEKLVILEQQQDQVNNRNLAEASRDNMKIYLNNFKKLSVKEETNKFEQSLISNEKINYTIDLLNMFNVGEKNQGNGEASSDKNESIEKFRTDKRKSLSFNNSINLSNLTIYDVFEDKANVFDLNSNDKSKRINFNENIQMIIEEDSNLNTLTYNFNKNAFQQLKSELDCNFAEDQENNSVNYAELNHDTIKQHILKYVNSLSGKQKKKKISFDFAGLSRQVGQSEIEGMNSFTMNEKNSLVFYNLLFLCQESDYNIFQESSFGNLVLVSD